MAVSFGIYTHTAAQKRLLFLTLQEEVGRLKSVQSEALLLQDELKLAVASQDDPDWIGLTLMKGLGVVPEGQIKIHFQ